jgi:D-alanyl-D-alanine carboxypeptidase
MFTRLLTAVLLGPILAVGAAETSLDHRVNELVTAQIELKSAIGISVGVAKGDQVLLARGYGMAKRDGQISAEARTVYRIGSITKQFTAAAVLLLAEDGKLKLDDQLIRFLPDYPVGDRMVTLRHLLHHTSGIMSLTSLPTYRRDMHLPMTHAESIARFSREPFNFEPGERYRYCNSGYYLLGVVIEKASGKSYEEFLTERIFDPVGMTATRYEGRGNPVSNRATGYSGWLGRYEEGAPVDMSQPFAAGALVSNVEDLIKWQHALAKDKLLSKTSFKQMTTRGKLNNGKRIDYALGINLRKFAGHDVIRHGGGIVGFRSDLLYLSDTDHTIVVLANCERSNPAKISDGIARLLIAEAESEGEAGGRGF